MSILSKPYFHDEAAAFAHLEAVLWPSGPICPHCGSMGRISKIKPNPAKRVRIGLHKCGDCGKQFTVKVGTVFEHGRIPLHKMLQAVHLMVASKKGVSAHQLHRILEVQYRTAWFLAHRIRDAMRDGSLEPLGGTGKVVEADETFIGRKKGVPGPKGGFGHKHAVLSLVERAGKVRTVHVENLTKREISGIVRANVDRESRFVTDEAKHYRAGEGVCGPRSHSPHFSRVRRSHRPDHPYEHGRGVLLGFQARHARHLPTLRREAPFTVILLEFDFRYNHRAGNGYDDAARADQVLAGIKGKRLTYRQPDQTL